MGKAQVEATLADIVSAARRLERAKICTAIAGWIADAHRLRDGAAVIVLKAALHAIDSGEYANESR